MSDSSDVVYAVEQVESAVTRVEQAVKGKWSSALIIGWMLDTSTLLHNSETSATDTQRWCNS
jgi:hypothetical protein